MERRRVSGKTYLLATTLAVLGTVSQATISAAALEEMMDLAGAESSSALRATGSLGLPNDYSFDNKYRTQVILKGLRSGKPPLEILDEKLPDEKHLNFSLAMKAWDNRPYQCVPVIEDKSTKDGR